MTDREAQLSNVRGGANTRGFSAVHTRHIATGSTAHQPSHTRLQIAATSNAGTGMRV